MEIKINWSYLKATHNTKNMKLVCQPEAKECATLMR